MLGSITGKKFMPDTLGLARAKEIEEGKKAGATPADLVTVPELQRIIGVRLDTMPSGLVNRMDEVEFKRAIESEIEWNTGLLPNTDFFITDMRIISVGIIGTEWCQKRVSGRVALRPRRDEDVVKISFGHAYYMYGHVIAKAWFNNFRINYA